MILCSKVRYDMTGSDSYKTKLRGGAGGGGAGFKEEEIVSLGN